MDRFPVRVFAFDEFGPLGIRLTAGSGWAARKHPDRVPTALWIPLSRGRSPQVPAARPGVTHMGEYAGCTGPSGLAMGSLAGMPVFSYDDASVILPVPVVLLESAIGGLAYGARCGVADATEVRAALAELRMDHLGVRDVPVTAGLVDQAECALIAIGGALAERFGYIRWLEAIVRAYLDLGDITTAIRAAPCTCP